MEEAQTQTHKMGLYSPSSSNGSLHPGLSSDNLNLPLNIYCYLSSPGFYIFTSWNITTIVLLLPLCISIFYYGLQEWLKKRSTSSAAAMSHSDCFTYHMATIELVGVFGSIFICCAMYKKDLVMFPVAFLFVTFTWFGQVFFHILTCVERYLAVVHPITYRSLRNERGTRIRNISVGCAWLLCFVGMGLVMLEMVSAILDLFLMSFAMTLVSFCSLSVLYSLIRPGPGEQGGGRERVDQLKLRAFYTIVAILGVLVLRFTYGLIWAVLYILGKKGDCGIMASGVWSSIPSSLVLPLLFLQRAGKCLCCKKTIQ